MRFLATALLKYNKHNGNKHFLRLARFYWERIRIHSATRITGVQIRRLWAVYACTTWLRNRLDQIHRSKYIGTNTSERIHQSELVNNCGGIKYFGADGINLEEQSVRRNQYLWRQYTDDTSPTLKRIFGVEADGLGVDGLGVDGCMSLIRDYVIQVYRIW